MNWQSSEQQMENKVKPSRHEDEGEETHWSLSCGGGREAKASFGWSNAQEAN